MKKICLVGNFAVGKTSLVRRYVDRQFSDEYLSTVGVKISKKLLQVPGTEGTDLQMLIWDIQGSEHFKSVEPAYLKGASGAIIVADLTRPDTIAGLGDHLKQFLDINPDAAAIVAWNKADLTADHAPLTPPDFTEKGNVLASVVTSAKSGKGVEDVFETLGKALVQRT